MSIALTKAVDRADASGRFIGSQELSVLKDIVADGERRTDIANRIANNATAIVANAARSLFVEQPQLVAPGGNAYTSRRMAACLRDMEIILRYITYAMVANDASILDDRCLNGLRETYLALGTPSGSVARAVQNMKDLTLKLIADQRNSKDLSDLLSELASYFDGAAASVG